MPQPNLQKLPNQAKIIKDYDPKKQKQANKQQVYLKFHCLKKIICCMFKALDKKICAYYIA